MIYFDVTKSGSARHQSGLMRVSARLREELGASATPVVWRGHWAAADGGRAVELTRLDWLLTPELFSEAERPGFWAFLRNPPCRLAAVFHDAIPLKFPQITWPQSVGRHPEYLKMLAWFDRVFAVSEASRSDLVGFWAWQGIAPHGRVSSFLLGADLAGQPRVTAPSAESGAAPPLFLCLGIVEPRKNQGFLLDVAEELLRRGVRFRLEFVGRVNPHFGRELARRLTAAGRAHPELCHRAKLGDAELLALWRGSRATLFPTLAEGCGLPLLESLWMGVPCVCSDLPVLRENADGGGCRAVPIGEPKVWADELERLAVDPETSRRLRAEATSRALPTWKAAASTLADALGADR